MENLNQKYDFLGNNENQINGAENGIEDNYFNSNEIGENEHGGYDSFKSLELEELEREFDRLFGTFTENEPETAKTTTQNIQNGINVPNANGDLNQKTNVFGNYKTGIDLGENTTGVYGNFGINDSNNADANISAKIGVNTDTNAYPNIGLNFETSNTPNSANGVFGKYGINSNLNNGTQENQQEFIAHQQTSEEPVSSVFKTYQQTQQSQKQQAVTVVKKIGFWAKIKAFFTGSSTTATTTNNKATSTQVGYNQNLNATNTNVQSNSNSTTSKGFWSIFKGNK